MSKLNLVKGSCAEQNSDVIVNAANKYLMAGSGICGVIFNKAGIHKLSEACNKYERPLSDGEAVITPAFDMKNTKYIIHAVGPNFCITPNADDKLENAYYNSLNLLKNNNLHSISFPLISSGIYGGMKEKPALNSYIACKKAYDKFVKENENYEINLKICAYTNDEYNEIIKEKIY